MICSDSTGLLSAWLDGELSGFEEREVCDHLDRCPSCRVIWRAMRILQGRIDGFIEPEVPPELWERITTEFDECRSKETSVDTIVTARGRMFTATKEEELCLNMPFIHPLSRLNG
jgi:anti-sigma factor RsiW